MGTINGGDEESGSGLVSSGFSAGRVDESVQMNLAGLSVILKARSSTRPGCGKVGPGCRKRGCGTTGRSPGKQFREPGQGWLR